MTIKKHSSMGGRSCPAALLLKAKGPRANPPDKSAAHELCVLPTSATQRREPAAFMAQLACTNYQGVGLISFHRLIMQVRRLIVLLALGLAACGEAQKG